MYYLDIENWGRPSNHGKHNRELESKDCLVMMGKIIKAIE